MADQLKLPLSHRRKLSNCRPPTRIFKFIFQSRTGISTVEESRAELRVESKHESKPNRKSNQTRASRSHEEASFGGTVRHCPVTIEIDCCGFGVFACAARYLRGSDIELR